MSLVLFSIFANLHAQSSGGASSGGGLMGFLPIVLIFGVFYFLVMRPQKKQRQEHQKFINSLKKGDEVVSNSGVIGKINAVQERFVMFEISEGTIIKILKSSISANAKTLIATNKTDKK